MPKTTTIYIIDEDDGSVTMRGTFDPPYDPAVPRDARPGEILAGKLAAYAKSIMTEDNYVAGTAGDEREDAGAMNPDTSQAEGSD